jgi:hypothetical protein
LRKLKATLKLLIKKYIQGGTNMKNFIASLLLATFIANCSGIVINNREKTEKKHRYGEKILVLQNDSRIH